MRRAAGRFSRQAGPAALAGFPGGTTARAMLWWRLTGGRGAAGGGSGGTIRLVAPQIGGAGSLSASGQSRCGVSSPPGRVRLEAFNVAFAGGTTPSAAVSLSTGPVTATSNPGLIKLPSLMITAIG